MAYNTIEYYDAESEAYSRKRYEGELLTNTQYIFRKRLDIFLRQLKRTFSGDRRMTMLEIGCADGVIMNAIVATYSKYVGKIVGLDISPLMIETASKRNKDERLVYLLRDDAPTEKYDAVIELGVHIEDWDKEMKYVADHLVDGGHFLFSVAGKKSIHARLKLKNAEYLKDYKTYKEVEEVVVKYFDIVEGEVYGLFTPKLWAVPPVARILQPVIDGVFKYFVPELFHEKIYLLRKK